MPDVTGIATTYDLPNFVGELFNQTPQDTPFLSSIGGLTGGDSENKTHFTWQTYDLRDAGQNTRVEGADAPDGESRVRNVVSNVAQIHQEVVEISYTKLAATGQFGDLEVTHPNVQGVAGANPVNNELSWQVQQMLAQIARDAEYSFVNGVFQDPGDNQTARQTRGILEAIVTNVEDADDAGTPQPLTAEMLLDLMQSVWSNGGIMQTESAAVMVNGFQKRKLTQEFVKEHGYRQDSRTVGGVSVDTILTDFGELGVMLNRHMPAGELAVVSLEQCAPVFVPIPGKGFLFAEPLANTGAAERTQIYGEIGLKYGNERAHGKIINLATS